MMLCILHKLSELKFRDVLTSRKCRNILGILREQSGVAIASQNPEVSDIIYKGKFRSLKAFFADVAVFPLFPLGFTRLHKPKRDFEYAPAWEIKVK